MRFRSTGTGVISLIAAQSLEELFPCVRINIDAIDIDNKACIDAQRNFNNSPWETSDLINLSLYNYPLQEFNEKKYNLIISNPPFFIDSLKPSSESKTNARHTDSLTQDDLIKGVIKLIKPNGIFALVLPYNEGELFLSKIEFILNIAKKRESDNNLYLHLKRKTFVKTSQKKAPKRVLLEMIACKAIEDVKVIIDEIIIMDNNGFTPYYKLLTKDFYLNF